MTEDSLEFQPMPGENQETVRNSFRVPVSGKDNVQAVSDNKAYTVINISPSGISIHSDSYLEFESGQIIEDAALVIDSQRISGLTAKVVHCSIHDSGNLQFGLAWLNMDPKDKKCLDLILMQMKNRVLEKGQAPDEKA